MAGDGIPDYVKVKAQKGFRGMADGKFQEVKVGEIVEVHKDLAIELRSSQKAVMVPIDTPLHRVKDKKDAPAAKEEKK